MKVQFLGAAQTVTGSCYMIEACGKRFCIDCGMHQGNKAIEERNRNPRPYAPGNIDFILVTHAHIDHSGLLPLMVREGFSKPIYCTKATSELLEIMLQDSAHIQEMEAQWEAKKYSRRGLKNPPKADYIFMESTYGDRNHKNEDISDQELADAIAYSYSKGEKVIIPAFAVERTQEILYCLHILQSKGKLPADMPVFVDSPLAIRATEVFRRNRELFDEDAQKMLHQGDDPFELPNLRYTLDAAESQSINEYKGPAIIISASGMCNAGRVRHHLKHNIWRPGASIVFVGYQAVGTPGRKIVEKASKITLFGEDMEIAARIYTINGFSAHAGQDQLLSWLEPLVHDKANVVLVHGEEKAQSVLAGLIREKFGVTPLVPGYMEEMILEGHQVAQTVQHEALAHPRVNWDFLTGEVERKWGMFKGKLADIEQSPWVQQTELQDALAKMDYALTRLLSRM